MAADIVREFVAAVDRNAKKVDSDDSDIAKFSDLIGMDEKRFDEFDNTMVKLFSESETMSQVYSCALKRCVSVADIAAVSYIFGRMVERHGLKKMAEALSKILADSLGLGDE